MILPWNSTTMPYRVIVPCDGREVREDILRQWCTENVGREGTVAECYQYAPRWEYKDDGGMWWSSGRSWIFRNYSDAFNFVMYWK